MDKMDGKTMDIVAENVGKLKELFPEAFTEGKVDFEALKEVLGTFVDDRDERYSFTWNGKSKARMIAQTPSTGTLRPCKEESVNWDTTQNIFIEGDNLEVLKLLQKSYHKKVKMIYIDPPYNTGKDFVYKDNFKDNIKNYKEITGQVDGEGRNLSNNPETSGRYHTDWLNMMYPRLKLARNLLKDDGVIFISIDDNEVSNLRKMCDEIFGEENLVAEFVWKSKLGKVGTTSTISATHEYILCFAKQSDGLSFKMIEKASEGRKENLRQWGQADRREDRPSMYYPIMIDGIEVLPIKDDGTEGRWRVGQESANELLKSGFLELVKKDTGYNIYRNFPAGISTIPYDTLLLDEIGTSAKGSFALKSLDLQKYFDYPKSCELLEFFIMLCTNEEDLILDFFAGSATTAHSVFKKNIGENTDRKFIMVQLPEFCDAKTEAYKDGYKTIAEISKERIRRAAAKIKEENPEYQGDLGFKVFKLDSTNIKPWEVDFDMTERTLEDFISNIKTDRREEDVLYEILLKYGLDLTLPISEHTIAGQKVFDIGMGALIICLADAISLDVVEGMAKLKEELNPEIMRVVFKDSGFKDDVVKTNAVQILKQAGIIDVRSL